LLVCNESQPARQLLVVVCQSLAHLIEQMALLIGQLPLVAFELLLFLGEFGQDGHNDHEADRLGVVATKDVKGRWPRDLEQD
jgi:hypothetical protein